MNSNNMKHCLIFILLIFNTGCANNASQKEKAASFEIEAGQEKLKMLFKKGDNGYACYRISGGGSG